MRTLAGGAIGSAAGRTMARGTETVFTVNLVAGGSVRVVMDGDFRIEEFRHVAAYNAVGTRGFDLGRDDAASDGDDVTATIAVLSGQPPFGPFAGWVATLPDVATSYCTAKTNSQGCTRPSSLPLAAS